MVLVVSTGVISLTLSGLSGGALKQFEKVVFVGTEEVKDMPHQGALSNPDDAATVVGLQNAMIDAYARNMQWERALSLFGRMEKAEGMAPTLETYNSLINACARANQAVAAIGLFSRMRQTSLRPSHRTINPLLAVLASNGAIQEALDIYEEMEMMETGTRRMGARLPPPNKRTYLTILAMLDGDEHTSRRDEVTSCASRRGWEGLVRPSTLQQMR